MLLRLEALGLMLCTLLAWNAAGAQPRSGPGPLPPVYQSPEVSTLADVAMMWLYVVDQGRIRTLDYTPEDLQRMPVLPVAGYVTGVVMLSTVPLDISVDGRRMDPVRADAEGLLKLKYFGSLRADEFWSTFLPDEHSRTAPEQIQGRYCRFPKVVGDALSMAPELPIVIRGDDKAYRLTVRQDAGAKLQVCSPSSAAARTPEFFYLGADRGQFDQAPEDFQQRMNAILAGIRKVEKAADGRFVERVRIIDYDGPRNAYSCEGENEIWLYSRVFWNEPVDELRILSEHEVMHILSDRLKLPTSPRMRELFATLMGFQTFSRERFYVVATGFPPADATGWSAVPAAGSPIFDFINEVNFIRGMHGGHSRDSLDEFCASFLHTLIYIDRLEHMIGQPLKSYDGSLETLSADERLRLIVDYRDVLDTMIKEMPASSPVRLTSFFRSCRDTSRKVGRVIETERAALEQRSRPGS